MGKDEMICLNKIQKTNSKFQINFKRQIAGIK